MKKIFLSLVFVFAFVAVTPTSANSFIKKTDLKTTVSLELEKDFSTQINLINLVEDDEILDMAALCATAAFHGANAIEATLGGLTFEEWEFYFNLIHASCLAME